MTHTPTIQLADIVTTAATSITSTTAESGGIVLNDGGATITFRGVCGSTSPNPTTADYHITAAGTTGTFTVSIVGLSANVLYHTRAYAINSVGTAYGNEQDFTTASGGSLASVTLVYVSNITYNTADAVSSVSGTGVTARGICWSSSVNPTISGSKTTDGSGAGSFNSTATGLSTCTYYYVRAYATNGNGTAYSDNIQFQTLPPIGLSDFDFLYAYGSGGSFVNFTGSEAEAWNGINIMITSSVARYGRVISSISFGIGNRIYTTENNILTCSSLSNGYYACLLSGTWYVVIIVSGVITDIQVN